MPWGIKINLKERHPLTVFRNFRTEMFKFLGVYYSPYLK